MWPLLVPVGRGGVQGKPRAVSAARTRAAPIRGQRSRLSPTRCGWPKALPYPSHRWRMPMSTLSFGPVWFSTDRQLSAVACSWESASIISKLLGKLEVPSDCAWIEGTSRAQRFPLAMQAQGVINLNEKSLTFRAIPWHRVGWRGRGLLNDLCLDLFPKDVLKIEPADSPSPVMRVFEIPFTRILTSKPSPIDNFLLCIGGKRMRRQSQELREKLLLWHQIGQAAR
jgi:hypothetical protein